MKTLESNVTASAEEIQREHELKEAMKMLGQAYIPFVQMDLIKQVFDKSSDNGLSPFWGSLSVYELGRIHGIRAERKRRKNGDPDVNKSIAV